MNEFADNIFNVIKQRINEIFPRLYVVLFEK